MYSERFNLSEYRTPDRSYAPIYSWLWNAKITEEETDNRLAEMQRLGIKRFYIIPIPQDFRPTGLPSEMSPDYLTDEYFAQYRYAVKRARALGMEVWLYDEGGWPSGGACGKVLAESNDYAQEYIRADRKALSAGEKYQESADIVAAFIGLHRIKSGYVADSNVVVDEYKKVVARYAGTSQIPDITKAEATDAFLRMTHEKYAAAIGDEFGKTVTAVFTDEPTGPRPFPYRKELSDAFFARYHTKIEDFLPFFFGNEDLTDETRQVKIKWFELCNEYFCRNFLEKEKDWSEHHGMVFLGHLDKDDEPNASLRGGSYQLLRALRKFDVPGVDAIHRQIYVHKEKVEQAQGARKDGRFTVEKANRFFPRYASSAAAQVGGRHALTESFAVYGNGLTFEEMRYVLNFQAVRGVNVFNLMMLSYGKNSFLRTGELPHFAETHACFKDLAAFNQYAERLSYLSSLGERVAEVALYFPVRDSYVGENFKVIAEHYEAVGESIERAHIDFDIFDDDVVMRADETLLSQGVISVGKAMYYTLVLPYCTCISNEAQARLEKFIGGGGKVICVSLQGKAVRLRGAKCTALSELSDFLVSPLKFVGESKGFSVSRARIANGSGGDLYMIFNGNECAAECEILRPDGFIYLLDDFSEDAIYALPNTEKTLRFSLASGQMVALICTDESIDATPLYSLAQGEKLKDWTFRKTSRFRIGENDFLTERIDEPASDVSLGDWRERVGCDFSGSGVYETSFTWSDDADAVLDLGDVKYSCELFLNGCSLGKKVMPPYRYFIPRERLQKENSLSLRVTNSCANEFHYTHEFDKYEKYKLTSYIDIEAEYLEDSLAGGLFGDVKLYKRK